MATSNNLDGLASSSSSSVGSEATKRPTSSQETQVLDKKRLQVSYFLGCTSQDKLKPFHTYLSRSSQNSKIKIALLIRNDKSLHVKSMMTKLCLNLKDDKRLFFEIQLNFRHKSVQDLNLKSL